VPNFFHAIEPGRGLQTLADDACKLLSFAKLGLAFGESHQGSVPGDREAVLVMLSGRAKVEIQGHSFEVGQRQNVFAGLPHSVYLPKGSNYIVTALSNMEAALPSAPSDLDIDPYEIRPEQVNTGQWGTLNYTRYFREILVEPDDRPASSLIVGETITPSGNWSTYPPHKHEANKGSEVFHEEMYYFRVSSPDGYGLTHHYSPERDYDDVYHVTDDTLLSIPHGYHSYVGAPGTQSYYLWFLAGEGRTQGVTLDPKVGWVQKTVGMV